MADNNTILEQLAGLVARFEEVSTLITDVSKRQALVVNQFFQLFRHLCLHVLGCFSAGGGEVLCLVHVDDATAGVCLLYTSSCV